MNLRSLIAYALLFVLFSLSAACSKSNSETAKNPVEQLIELCKQDNYAEAAKHMRYPGMDESRKDQTANYETGDADEKSQIEMSCKRNKALANLSYAVSPERMSQGFYVYDVEVKDGSKISKTLWAFKKSGNDYVLVDVDFVRPDNK